MSLTEEELSAMKDRANKAIDNVDKNELAAQIGADVLMLFLHMKIRDENTLDNLRGS